MSSISSIFQKLRRKAKNIPYVREPHQYSRVEEYQRKNKWITHPYKKSKTRIEGFDVLMEAYKNPIIYSCVNVIVQDIIDQKWKIVDKQLNTSDTAYCEYLTRLLERPENDNTTFADFLELFLKSYLITGNAFAYRVLNEDNVLIGYQYISPDRIEYDLECEQYKLKNTDFYFEDDELIHLYDKQIDESPFGLSKIEVLAFDISMELQAQTFNKELIRSDNLAPRGVLKYSSDLQADDFDVEKQRLEIEQEDAEKRRGTLIVHGADYQPINLTPEDIQYLELLKYITQRAMAVFRVPPEKLQIIETANLGAGTGESQNKTYLQNIASLLNKLEILFTNSFRMSGRQECLEFDDLDMETPKSKAELHKVYLETKVLTINEVRENLGLEAVAWGDAPYSQNNDMQVQDDGSLAVERNLKNVMVPELEYDNIKYDLMK